MFAPLSAFETQAILLSLQVSLASLLLTVPCGVATGWVLARGRFPGKWLVEALVNLPLVLPPVVTGLALLIVFGARGPVGGFLRDAFGLTLAFSWIGAAVACGVMAFPLVVRPVRLAFEAVDRGLEQAASTLGASPLSVFLRITLPLALPGVLAGALLGFARAFGEFGATVTFAGSIPGETQTLPVAIYTSLQRASGETAALRLAGFSIVVSIGALVVTEWLNRHAQKGRSAG
ncbi:molybdate ABC transporter permease subunit [Brevundimonas sp.]|uniref:molybdate ABC transporter permease subunit n=1 Tax=Brevundimonas sp. TaxID=1871086 RepID=UPI002898FE9C|nr:molybdate ABC transporter permease subunit [Brevundimonas sp.]